jgi:hypothetical protein
LDQALQNAAYFGHFEALGLLLSDGRQISQMSLERDVLAGSSQGHFAVVQYLLSRGRISESVRDTAIRQVSGPRRDEIIHILRRAQTVESSVNRQMGNSKRISLDYIKEDPIAVLTELSLEELPAAFLLEGNRAIDVGGVSKQVYSTLFEALKEKNLLFLTDYGIPEVLEENNLGVYDTLGRFYCHFICKNIGKTDPYFTGYVFSPLFFNMIKIARAEPNDDKALARLLLSSVQGAYRPFLELIINPESIEHLEQVKEYLADAGLEDEDPVRYSEKVLGYYIKPVQALIQGAQESDVSTEFFSMIDELQDQQICDKIQGLNLSIEQVLAALDYNGPQNLDH